MLSFFLWLLRGVIALILSLTATLAFALAMAMNGISIGDLLFVLILAALFTLAMIVIDRQAKGRN